MSDDVRETAERANTRLTILLNDARCALRGESNFGVEEIQRIRQPLNEMESILDRSAQLRQFMPEMSGQLDRYKANLGELQTVLDQVRVMLLARQASMLAGRTHLDVAHWMTAFQATR